MNGGMNQMSGLAEAPREKLREIVARDGSRILDDPDRCEGLLKDYCGEHRREISALVGALEERVPMELRSSWQTAMTPEAMRARLVQRLRDNRGLAPEIADWAVDAWSYALGVGLTRSSDRLASNVISTPPLPPPPPPPPVMQQHGQWVGSQIVPPPPAGAYVPPQQPFANPGMMPPPPPPPPAPPQPSGNALRFGAIAAVLAVGGYFAAPYVPVPNNPFAGKDPSQQQQQGQQNQQQQQQQGQGQQNQQQQGQQQQQQQSNPVPAPVPVPPPAPAPAPVQATFPAGTQLSVKLPEAVASNTVTAGQYLNATLSAPLADGAGKSTIPAGSKVILQVTEVDTAGRLAGVPQVKLALYQIEVNGKAYNASSTPYIAKGPSRTTNTVKKGGIGGAIGCGVGAVVGVFKRKPKTGCGVGAGAGAGTGVAVAATDEIKPAVIPAGTVIRLSLIRPVQLG